MTVRSNKRLQIGCVPFLNAKPLLEGLDAEITLLPPNPLAARFREGEFDTALLPSIEALREGYEILPGMSISSEGKTESVRLHHRTPISKINTVALDENSRTSNALIRILLQIKYAVFPSYVTWNPSSSAMPDVDAALTIGDVSFQDYGLPFLDLGSEWKDFTGKPFVYAVWVCRKEDSRKEEIQKVLLEACEKGKKAISSIARRESSRLGISEQYGISYLTDCISFSLGTKEQAALREFDQYARQIEVLT